MEHTYCFRVHGECFLVDRTFKRPKYKYVTATTTEQAYNIINYLNPNRHIIRVDHLTDDALLKLLEYDFARKV